MYTSSSTPLLNNRYTSLLDVVILLFVLIAFTFLDYVSRGVIGSPFSSPDSDSATASCGSTPPSTPVMMLEGDGSSEVPDYASSTVVEATSSSSSLGESGDSRSFGEETSFFSYSLATCEDTKKFKSTIDIKQLWASRWAYSPSLGEKKNKVYLGHLQQT